MHAVGKLYTSLKRLKNLVGSLITAVGVLYHFEDKPFTVVKRICAGVDRIYTAVGQLYTTIGRTHTDSSRL